MPLYEPFNWLDHIRDADTGETIQQGTPVSATRMNYIEQGIADSSEGIASLESNKANIEPPHWVEPILLNGAYAGSASRKPQFRKELNTVFLEGGIWGLPWNGGTTTKPIFRLPAGFTPDQPLILGIASLSSSALSLTVSTIGDVCIQCSGAVPATAGIDCCFTATPVEGI